MSPITESVACGLSLYELADRLADHHTDPVVRDLANRVIAALDRQEIRETEDESDDD